MNKRTLGTAVSSLAALGLSVVLGAGCSGRAVEQGPSTPAGGETGTVGGATEIGGTSALGGTSAQGGAPSGGAGSVGKAGAPSGGAASGGAASAGAANAGAGNTCGVTNCPLIACGDGATLVYPPGQCCPVCVSPCQQQTCPEPSACAQGFHLATATGDCCPSCVPNPVPDCAAGQMAYANLRSMLVSKYTSPCMSDADCSTVLPNNQCESGCNGYVAITNTALANLVSNLGNEAMDQCGGCAPTPTPNCSGQPPPTPFCAKGTCTFGNE